MRRRRVLAITLLEVLGGAALAWGLYRVSPTVMLVVLGVACLGIAIALELAGSRGVPPGRAR